MRFNQLILIISLSSMNLFWGCKNEGEGVEDGNSSGNSEGDQEGNAVEGKGLKKRGIGDGEEGGEQAIDQRPKHQHKPKVDQNHLGPNRAGTDLSAGNKLVGPVVEGNRGQMSGDGGSGSSPGNSPAPGNTPPAGRGRTTPGTGRTTRPLARPSNVIDVMFESFMTSRIDEKYIVRSTANENFVRSNGATRPFTQFISDADVDSQLSFLYHEDHLDITGCIRYGRPSEGSSPVYNFVCMELQILFENTSPFGGPTVMWRDNSSPEAFILASGVRPEESESNPSRIHRDYVDSFPQRSVQHLVSSLEQIDVDSESSSPELIVAIILSRIIREHDFGHIAGINHGPFTIGQVTRGRDRSIGWVASSPPRVVGQSTYLRSIEPPPIDAATIDAIERGKLLVGRNITSTLLTNYDRTFQRSIGRNTLINVGYNQMPEYAESRTAVWEIEMQHNNVIRYTPYSRRDDTYSSSSFEESVMVGTLVGCFIRGATKMCLGLNTFASNVFSDQAGEYENYPHFLNYAGPPETPQDVDVNRLAACSNIQESIDNIPQCLGELLNHVNGLLGEGRTIHALGIEFIKYSSPVSSSSSSSSLMTGQFSESNIVYIRNQYYYVGKMINDGYGSPLDWRYPIVWLPAHCGIPSAFTDVRTPEERRPGPLVEELAEQWTFTYPSRDEPEGPATTDHPQFSVVIGESQSTAVGCWITITDPRAIRVFQICVSMVMFHVSWESLQAEWATIGTHYESPENALSHSAMGGTTTQHSLVTDSSFLNRLTDCGIDVETCVGVVATKLFAHISHQYNDAKQSIVGVYLDKLQASVVPTSFLSPEDRARASSAVPFQAFVARNFYHGSGDIRFKNGYPVYFALRPSEANREWARTHAFTTNATSIIASRFVEMSRHALAGEHHLGGSPVTPSPGWVERSGDGDAVVVAVVPFETKLDPRHNGITFVYNEQSMMGSINGCFDMPRAGLRFCIVAQIFERVRGDDDDEDEEHEYRPFPTPQDALTNAPQSTARDDVVGFSHPRVATRLERGENINSETPQEVLESWTNALEHYEANLYIDSINIVGMKFGPYLNETHFAPGHVVTTNGFYLYRTEPPSAGEE